MCRMYRFFLSICFLFTSCAYGYAGQEGKQRSEETIRQDVKVVEVKKVETKPVDDKTAPVRTSKMDPDSPCGISRFSIYFYERGSRVEKVIDCKARKVVDTKREGFEPALYEEAVASNIPQQTWYFLVDPHGGGNAELSNDHLIRLSREFQIEFFGRHEKRNLLIYTFLDKL